MQGVYLKYVALGAITGFIAVSTTKSYYAEPTYLGLGVCSVFWYLCVVNSVVAVLFRARKGMELIGKDVYTGQIPTWSYVVWAGFHFPTWLYTYVHHIVGNQHGVPNATEVIPGWWLGGRYSNDLKTRSNTRQWAGVVDLTCEFPEPCADTTDNYLLCRVWDGVPPSPEKLEECAVFCANVAAEGPGKDVLVHCAHGRGRSTTVMCAALVRAGKAPDWESAFQMCKAKRHVVGLNSMMRRALTEWAKLY